VKQQPASSKEIPEGCCFLLSYFRFVSSVKKKKKENYCFELTTIEAPEEFYRLRFQAVSREQFLELLPKSTYSVSLFT
jgi:hypothetical protein